MIDYLLNRTLGEDDGIQLSDGFRLTDADYAEDIPLLDENVTAAQSLINRLVVHAGYMGQHIKAAKTKVMHVNAVDDPPPPLICLSGRSGLKYIVDVFRCLGSQTTNDCRGTTDIENRIARASAVFASFKAGCGRGRTYQPTEVPGVPGSCAFCFDVCI